MEPSTWPSSFSSLPPSLHQTADRLTAAILWLSVLSSACSCCQSLHWRWFAPWSSKWMQRKSDLSFVLCMSRLGTWTAQEAWCNNYVTAFRFLGGGGDVCACCGVTVVWPVRRLLRSLWVSSYCTSVLLEKCWPFGLDVEVGVSCWDKMHWSMIDPHSTLFYWLLSRECYFLQSVQGVELFFFFYI